MLIQEKNEYGVITVDDALFQQLIKDSLKQFEGKVWLVNNFIGDILNKINNQEGSVQYEITDGNNGKVITVYLIAKFGESLSTMANLIIKNLYASLSEDLEMDIENIHIVYTGLLTNKGIIRKDSVYSLHE